MEINQELHKKLEDKIANNKASEKKIYSFIKEVEVCYITILQQDSTIITHEDEIASLKSEITLLKKHLQQVQQEVRHKGNASTA